jgi:carbon monoxide dehydrogenase subunit G
MDFTNSFTVNVPLDRVWEHLLDAEKVTPCVPGAQLTETIDDRHHKGTIKVKLGAVQMSYRGQLEMEPDEEAHTILLRAKGTETRGSGGASGVVTTTLSSDENGATMVVMESHVDVTGRVAQFGRGIMQDVANRLVKDFARCLESHLIAGEEAAPAADAVAAAQPTPTPQTAEQQPVERGPAARSRPEAEAPEQAPRPIPGPAASPVRSPSRPPMAATEIRPVELLIGIGRSRLAKLLRLLADKLEPKT